MESLYVRFRFLALAALSLVTDGVVCAADEVVPARPAMQREVLSGFTRERTRLVLSAETSGRVAEVNGEVGEVTPDGRPFACLDRTFVELELAANRTQQEAQRVDLTYYRKEVERLRQLVRKNSSSESQLDAAQRDLDKTRTQLDALEIAAETLRERRERHCIRPPAGWRIISRHVEPGVWVNAGQPMVEVGDYTRLLVPFALDMDAYRALREREDLRVRLPEEGREVPARLLHISPAFDEVSRKIQVELEIADGVESSRGGLRVELALEIPQRGGAVLVPQAALEQRYEQYWLARPGGERVRVVYLGRADDAGGDGWAQVSAPEVKPGDLFLLNGE